MLKPATIRKEVIHVKIVKRKRGCNCFVVKLSKKEQKERGVREFEALFTIDGDDVSGFVPSADFDTLDEVCEFLDWIDWRFDNYEPKEVDRAIGILIQLRIRSR